MDGRDLWGDEPTDRWPGLPAEFALRGINLSRIESRPTKERLGEYRFFLDFDGHVADARIGDALAALRREDENTGEAAPYFYERFGGLR